MIETNGKKLVFLETNESKPELVQSSKIKEFFYLLILACQWVKLLLQITEISWEVFFQLFDNLNSK